MKANMRRSLALVAVCAAAVLSAPDTAQGEDTALFVVPARPKLVQFGLDMTRLRAGYVVTYQPVPGSDLPLLHVWDGSSGRWVEISAAAYLRGSVFRSQPQWVFLVGTDSERSPGLGEIAWSPQLVRIAQLDDISLLEAAGKRLGFDTREWRWLSGRYDIDLEDVNVEQRRHGRYGPWGQRHQRAPRPQPIRKAAPAVSGNEPEAWRPAARAEELPAPVVVEEAAAVEQPAPPPPGMRLLESPLPVAAEKAAAADPASK